jgi:hypothetical protein
MQFLIWLGIVVAGDTFCFNVVKRMVISVGFWKIPILIFV